MIGIYAIINKSNGKMYVGKSETDIGMRREQHLKLLKANKHYNIHLQGAFNKNPSMFDFVVIESCKIEDCNAREIYWIDKFNSCNPYYGYNMTYGGEGGKPNEITLEKIRKSSIGRRHTEETKKIISQKNKGSKRTDEEKLKISLSKIGKPSWNSGKKGIYSDETRRRMSVSTKEQNKRNPLIGEKNGMFGKNHSEKTKLKMSENRRGDKNGRYINFTNEQLLDLIEMRARGKSIKEMAMYVGVCEDTISRRIKDIKKGDEDGMSGYLAMRIEAGKLDYLAVVTRYPQFKTDIDTILVNDGFQDLIVEP